jgi:hypothetical protein
MTMDDSDACIIRGGGKRTGGVSTSTTSAAAAATANEMGSSWNVYPEHSYKPSIQGIIGGGNDSIAQIYVYGDTAYEVTLKGITFDNSITEDEMKLYDECVEAVEAGYVVDEEEEDENDVSFGGTSSSSTTPPSDNGATFELVVQKLRTMLLFRLYSPMKIRRRVSI